MASPACTLLLLEMSVTLYKMCKQTIKRTVQYRCFSNDPSEFTKSTDSRRPDKSVR
uniref:Uncharacterized protein n=1 Tax=Calidris pygmaea TaxID=425635 RepID=A0A8C3KAS2_9CHAR